MPIHFHSHPEQVQIEFLGGDLIVGLCGDDEEGIAVGIGEAPRSGVIGEAIGDELETPPSVYLSFHSAASIDTFIRTLRDYREHRFGSRE